MPETNTAEGQTQEERVALAFEILAGVIDPADDFIRDVSKDSEAGHIIYALASYTGSVVNQGHWQVLWADECRDNAPSAEEVSSTLRTAASRIRCAVGAPTWSKYHNLDAENQVLRARLRKAGIS